ncbi:hypothetical protein [Cyclobacterium sp. SYSU L10401]|uniref:hypothetical protein n=1 Tax=Cyclobacterium sp. SYSU L10401 TaxID=2678657 RepID=UPI0013CF6199|nr:hypothetical protein [Cyclobacterium sp. SYSU L10401]
MNYDKSFQESARLGLEELSKQSPVTLEQARLQVQRLRNQNKSAIRKKKVLTK